MSILTPQAAAEDRDAVDYPESDGQPMAETSVHVQAILLLFQALLDALPEPAFVAADLFWYWEGRGSAGHRPVWH